MIQIGYKKTPKNPRRVMSAKFVIKPINTCKDNIFQSFSICSALIWLLPCKNCWYEATDY